MVLLIQTSDPIALIPGEDEVKSAAKEEGNSGVAIWLGLLIDGIPEAIVIGATFFASLAIKGGEGGFLEFVPYTLLAGLFLSNFPEALSSSICYEKTWYGDINDLSHVVFTRRHDRRSFRGRILNQ